MPRLIAAALALGLLAGAGVANAQPRLHCDNDGRCVQIAGYSPANIYSARGQRQLVTVSTAAGIDITVARAFAPKIEGFVADLVARGYHPRRIHCFARGGHVRHSLHYSGRACDFDQRGWNKTARAMYRVRALARKWGLRDGCSFHDCGHIDVGRQVQQRWASR